VNTASRSIGMFLLAWVLLINGNAAHAATKLRPNIVILVADDWGYTDVGAYGSEISTPNLDSLARQGVKFSNFHVASVCSPTRAMLMTGVDNHRNGVGNMPETMPAEHEGKPGYEGVLNANSVTLATMLRDNGYQTNITGKWHLGKTPDKLPGKRGFDRSFIQADSGSDNWENRTYMMLYDKAYWFEQDREAQLPKDFYSSSFIVDKAIEYIKEGRKNDKPFFAYLGFQANHIPLQAPPEFVEKYRGRYDKGWEQLRSERRMGAIEKGLVQASTGLAKLPKASGWDHLSPEKKRWHAQHMEVYAAMAEAMDFDVGRLIAHLKATGEYENTVFVFLSDNGSDPANPFDIPAANAWVHMNYVTDGEKMGGKGTFSANGANWASATVSPLNGYKYFAAEGGLRVPLIISGVPGMVRDWSSGAFAHVNDIVPTVLQAAGVVPHTGTYRGVGVERMSGKTMLPLLLGKSETIYGPDEPVGYELAGSAALYKGDLKLVKNIAPLGDGKWRLYDLKTDPGEVHDLGSAQPERFKAMLADYDAYAKANGVLPLPDDFDLHKAGFRYALRHFVVPKIKTTLPWFLVVALGLYGGFRLLRRARRTRRMGPSHRR
jgi:arylsulfatase A-like enzyme